ncbi:hypothetical protein HP552_02655, partial [Paenibacillus xylanilyticus]|nr:hypothetical protein [Paenibacillus xylanilyticus]
MFGGGFNEIAYNAGGGENVIDLAAHLSGGAQMYSKRTISGGEDVTGFNLVAFNAPELSGDTEYSLDYAVEMTLSAEFS